LKRLYAHAWAGFWREVEASQFSRCFYGKKRPAVVSGWADIAPCVWRARLAKRTRRIHVESPIEPEWDRPVTGSSVLLPRIGPLVAIALGLAPGAAPAQSGFPIRTVKIIVPFPAGGANDLAARIVAEQLKVRWGQPVIVENHPGAAGNIGADIAAQAAPDGHTFMVSPPPPLVINKSLYRRLGYDPDAFVPITIINTITNVIVVRRDLATSVDDLIALVRRNPGKLTFASQGTGSTPYMTGYMFIALAGAPVVHVPYRGMRVCEIS
jgi:tripartite-type tricarboxylate transporter receptor subunit TctC